MATHSTPLPSRDETPPPRSMQAVTRRRYGGPDVVRVESVETPSPAAGELLVRVNAAGVDRATLHLLTGLPHLARVAFGLRRPKQPVLGQQFAGEVVAVGDGVSAYAVGDRVFGTARGSFAEFAIATPATLAPTPPTVTDPDAATVGVSGVTALEAVCTHGRVQTGEKVLVLGGSGAVGSYAVALAAHRGADVTAACSAGKRDFVQAQGASRAVDYRTVPLPEMGGPFDVIIDIAGNRSISQLRSALGAEGRLVIVGGEDGGALLGGVQRNLAATVANRFTRRELGWLFARTTTEGCSEVAALIADGALRPAIDRRVGLAGAADALAAMERGELRGQAVICL